MGGIEVAPIIEQVMSKSKSNENEVLNAVCEYLEVKGYIFWRQNTVGVFDPTKKIFRRPPKYSLNGISDVIVLDNGMAWFLEVKDKAPQSASQKEFEEKVKLGGCQYRIVRGIDDLQMLGF